MGVPAAAALAEVIGAERGRVRRIVPWRATTLAREGVERLLDRWDDAEAARLFAMNVELDEAIASRREPSSGCAQRTVTWSQIRPRRLTSESPAHLEWWMRGERGRVKVELLLDPERRPRVQALKLTSVPEPPAALAAFAARLAGLCWANRAVVARRPAPVGAGRPGSDRTRASARPRQGSGLSPSVSRSPATARRPAPGCSGASAARSNCDLSSMPRRERSSGRASSLGRCRGPTILREQPNPQGIRDLVKTLPL